jgi:FKBP-type peptidyl-prolyl cis-trans isomerase FkpA
MKKQNIILAVAAIFVLSSCNSNKTQMPELKTQLDSLNYAFGLANGNGIKQYYMQGDTTETAVESLLKGFDEGMKGSAKEDNAEMRDLGTRIGTALKEQSETGLLGDSTLKVNIALIKQGLINGMLKSDVQMTPEEAQMFLNTTMQKMQEKAAEKQFGGNKAAGELFLAENAKKAGVVVTESGLQYEVITKGTGATPADGQNVKVHYHGTLIDGTVFDSSVDRKEPIVLNVNGVIPGWTEALKLMQVGAKYKLYIPYQLAYGQADQGPIKPYSALVFEVELLSIEK